jgi:uncharacterized OsmC-like protein
MPSAVGGSGEGPSPGYFGRAAVCGCLAIGIKMPAARENMRLDAVRALIEQDWDNRGVFGVAGASPVPSDTRIAIEIESPEAEEKVRAMVSHAIAFPTIPTTGRLPWHPDPARVFPEVGAPAPTPRHFQT